MPYVKQQHRNQLDPFINKLIAEIHKESLKEQWQGNLNYCLTKIVMGVVGKEINYSNINNLIGVIECVKQELYRRVASPYEDAKSKENGDVY